MSQSEATLKFLKAIEQIRYERGLTYRDLHEITGIPISGLHGILKGNHKVTLDNAIKICEALNVKILEIAEL